jgi:hypothetical protein
LLKAVSMKTRPHLATYLAAAAVLVTACGSQPPARRPPSTPRGYGGTCVLAGIEQIPAPVAQTEDAVVLVARYRPSGGTHADSAGWSLRFQVQRARERDLRLHIEAHPTVLCDVDRAATAAAPAHIDVPPFQGQRGTVDQ